MKNALLCFLFLFGFSMIAFAQKKEPKTPERKSLSKRVYRNWVRARVSDENSSPSSRIINSLFQAFRPETKREE